MQSQQIRQMFLDFFRENGHEVVPSASLVPNNDKTLLFTNAGMVQFKDVFLGVDKRDYARATTAQRCVRAGGKHNDLENVGYTARHHTFFEMLGNFSFGDYFKKEAIEFAWTLVTEKFGLPAEKLWVTVFEEDDEAYDIWANDIGVPKERIARIGAKDNFWQMGDTGPCGPCSEIFYDHGEAVFGGPPGSPDEDGDRYIEIWNLVFMQYDRQADGTLIPLPRPSVDTGMGLERIAAILQGVHSNYEIDIFKALITAAAEATATKDLENNSLKVIADHIRATVFLLADGVIPSNEGRGYVLRRIMRRAMRHGHKLGQTEPFFYQLVKTVVAEMGMAYPEIVADQERITDAILREEKRFAETLHAGMEVLEKDLAQLKGSEIAGETVFKLYDTYGFPVDLTNDIARERGLTLDMVGYEQAMQQQRERAKAAGKFKRDMHFDTQAKTAFSGYDTLEKTVAVNGLFDEEGNPCQSLTAEQRGVVVLNDTPFYAESGGQIGDAGQLSWQNGLFIVEDTQKQGDTWLHFGQLQTGTLSLSQTVLATVDLARREAIKRNHSGTHLLHSALHQVLGKQAIQKGSLVSHDRLRFDFAHGEAISSEDLAKIEAIANREILANHPVETALMSQEEAKARGAMALFGEKYGDVVRVVKMGDDSIELCGGTHVGRTGEIGQLVITTEGGVAAGIRRIEALTGWAAIQWRRQKEAQLAEAAALLKTNDEQLSQKIEQLLASQKTLQKQMKALKKQLVTSSSDAFSLQEVNGYRLLTGLFEDYDMEDLREIAAQCRTREKADVVLLASINEGKVQLVASADKDKGLHAGKIIAEVAKIVDGKGGGRPDYAQGGGTNVAAAEKALAHLASLLATA